VERKENAMTVVHDLSQVVARSHEAVGRFVTGDPEPLIALYSRNDDVTIANPFGPPVRGWSRAAETMRRAATYYRDGRATGFELVAEYTTPGLAYVVELEHFESKIGGSETLTPFTLRVTTVLRPEDGTWRIVHRHADPITAPRAPESVIGAQATESGLP
jgi:ketosteroid isomerase-like protein